MGEPVGVLPHLSEAENPPAGVGLLCKPQSTKIKKAPLWVPSFYFGGPDRDRTGDLTDANRTLSQLSYRPMGKAPE